MIVYLATNTVNGMRYVGKTVQTLRGRVRGHKYRTTHLEQTTQAVHHAMSKYGFENFQFEVLEKCDSVESMDLAEDRWIRELCTLSPGGYNLRTGDRSVQISEETRSKLRSSHTGKKSSDDTKRRMAESARRIFQTEEGRNKQAKMIASMIDTKAVYFSFISPRGKVVSGRNLTKFCRENGLAQSHMDAVLKGRRPRHKGWVLNPNLTYIVQEA